MTMLGNNNSRPTSKIAFCFFGRGVVKVGTSTMNI